MRYKLLSVSKSDKLLGINIGDYVQALAASQFYPHIDGYLDRDMELNSYSGEKCSMIMNGWYMKDPANWPPSDKINPLFVAFHINTTAKEPLLSPESIAYLKKHQPIGCRDNDTMSMLQEHGVEAYFSGCMTLTLGLKYSTEENDNVVYIVDPIYNGKLTTPRCLQSILHFLLNIKDVSKLIKNKNLDLHEGRNIIKKFLKTSLYHKEYVRVFGRDIVLNAIYIRQDTSRYKHEFINDSERLNEAERLIKGYARAKFVITSRIHCALPCLGLNTPVIYLEKGEDSDESRCRLNGLRELFNIITVNDGRLMPQPNIQIPLDLNNPPKNKTLWKSLAATLIDRCRDFINQSSAEI